MRKNIQFLVETIVKMDKRQLEFFANEVREMVRPYEELRESMEKLSFEDKMSVLEFANSLLNLRKNP